GGAKEADRRVDVVLDAAVLDRPATVLVGQDGVAGAWVAVGWEADAADSNDGCRTGGAHVRPVDVAAGDDLRVAPAEGRDEGRLVGGRQDRVVVAPKRRVDAEQVGQLRRPDLAWQGAEPLKLRGAELIGRPFAH